MAGLFGLTLVYRLFVSGQLSLFLRARTLQLAGAFAAMALLALPALVVNVAETGRATPDLPNYINKPFSLVAAATTNIVTSASLFLAPIPDLDLDPRYGAAPFALRRIQCVAEQTFVLLGLAGAQL